MTSLSKTAQVLKYFAQQYRSGTKPGIPRTRLMKMAYLSDLLAREYLGQPITDFAYYRFHYGPYDRAIVDVVDELVAANLAELKFEIGDEYETKLLVDLGRPVFFDFSAGETEILSYVARNYLRMPLKELLTDVVYETLPMKQTSRLDETLPMGASDNRGKDAVGFDLEEMLLAERQIDEGKFTTDFASRPS